MPLIYLVLRNNKETLSLKLLSKKKFRGSCSYLPISPTGHMYDPNMTFDEIKLY